MSATTDSHAARLREFLSATDGKFWADEMHHYRTPEGADVFVSRVNTDADEPLNALAIPQTWNNVRATIVETSNYHTMRRDFPFLIDAPFGLALVPSLCEDVTTETFENVLEAIEYILDTMIYDETDYNERHDAQFDKDWRAFMRDNGLPEDTETPCDLDIMDYDDDTPNGYGYGFTFTDSALEKVRDELDA